MESSSVAEEAQGKKGKFQLSKGDTIRQQNLNRALQNSVTRLDMNKVLAVQSYDQELKKI